MTHATSFASISSNLNVISAPMLINFRVQHRRCNRCGKSYLRRHTCHKIARSPPQTSPTIHNTQPCSGALGQRSSLPRQVSSRGTSGGKRVRNTSRHCTTIRETFHRSKHAVSLILVVCNIYRLTIRSPVHCHIYQDAQCTGAIRASLLAFNAAVQTQDAWPARRTFCDKALRCV